MDLTAVYTELEAKLRANVSGLRVGKWSERPQVPYASFLLPDGLARTSYRGMWKISDVQLALLVTKSTARTGLADMYNYASAAWAALDPRTDWTSCADVTVTNCTFGTIDFGGAQNVYLGAVLHLDITGTGA